MKKIRKIDLLKKLSSYLFDVMILTFTVAIVSLLVLLMGIMFLPSTQLVLIPYLYVVFLEISVAVYLSGVVCAVAIICLSIADDRLSASVEELPEPLDSKYAIRSFHGSTLSEVMEALRDERLEYVAACSLDGKVIAEGTMLSTEKCTLVHSDRCALPDDCIFVHNHPSIYELAFSRKDLKNMWHSMYRTSVVVTTNFTYTLSWADPAKKSEIDADEFYGYIDQNFNVHTKASSSARRKDYNRQIQQFADRYGLIYTVENVRHKRCQAWFVRNQRRIGVAVSCAAVMLAIFCGPAKVAQDSASLLAIESTPSSAVESTPETIVGTPEAAESPADRHTEIPDVPTAGGSHFQPQRPQRPQRPPKVDYIGYDGY